MIDWAKVLEDDLNWREAELASLKLLVTDSVPGSVRQSSLLRALWTMLYAHYEGFCKFAWDFYLENLEQLGINRDVCCTPLARFSLTKRFRELRGDTSNTSLWSVCASDFNEWMKEELKFELHLETKCNLWPRLLRDNSSEIDLPHGMVEEHELKLKTLVARRNEIAHGKKMVISNLAEYQPYEDAVVLVMHELAVAVLDCLEKKTYLKTNPSV
jgi:MAE_28990/MAE_18760-like HEPN